MDTKSLIAKLDDIAKTFDHDVSTILAEQIKDPVPGTVRSWIRKRTSPEAKAPEIQQSKFFDDFAKNSTDFQLKKKDNFYATTSDKLNDGNLRVCLPLSLFLACFRVGHYNEISGHMCASKTYNKAKRFYYWPALFDWICALTADCLNCRNKKPKPKHRKKTTGRMAEQDGSVLNNPL